MKTISWVLLIFIVGYWISTQTSLMRSKTPEDVPAHSIDLSFPTLPQWRRLNTNPQLQNIKVDTKAQTQAYERMSDQEKMKYAVYFVQEIVPLIKERQPTRDEINSLTGILIQGGSREGVFRSLVYDIEYEDLISRRSQYFQEDSVNKILKIYQKYLGKSFDMKIREKVSKLEFKRIIIERFLEMTDLFVLDQRLDDMWRWYSWLSIDLVSSVPSHELNSVRSRQDKNFHYHWAKRVPHQVLKGELIIKLALWIKNL